MFPQLSWFSVVIELIASDSDVAASWIEIECDCSNGSLLLYDFGCIGQIGSIFNFETS